MKKAIIIGASSGIGRELAKVLSQNSYALGLTGRRTDLLESLRNDISATSFVKKIDISEQEDAMVHLENLISEMGGLDLIVISSGIGFLNTELGWKEEKETIDVNVTGFAAMTNIAFRYFLKQGSGHIVGISSIAALRGSGEAPAYNASKAFVSNYLEGLRQKVAKAGLAITVTDIQPGFVDTAMAKGEGLFWIAPTQKAAYQIYKAIEGRKKHAYITKRWRFIAWLLKAIPDRLYNKF
ncbi:MAG: SDR family NAD(P)-dependent oxidoreductase [Deltaproteobacteria bacterium]|nr:SDR family NAD(P)-dependent oxidoreductase [Deltaproteobacteria bacterium]